MTPPTTAAPQTVISAVVVATVSTVFPGFLIGALSVQVSEEFNVSESVYGWGLGGFFLAATVGSIGLGRLAQRIGPRRQVLGALGVSCVAQLLIASVAGSFGAIVALLAVAGFANSANQTGVNLLLSQANLPRLGLAIAIKQSGMPAASLFAGFAVPAVALTVGWRFAYVIGAIACVLAAINLARAIAPVGRIHRGSLPRPISSVRVLVLAAVAGGFLAFAAGALNAWLVSSGVASGMSPGLAGILLSVGAAVGITLRLMIGVRVDTMDLKPFQAAGAMCLVGALGLAGLSVGGVGIHIAATFLAFGGGWVWPVFTNFGIVRRNAEAAGSATGITQMGVYIGVFSAPLVTGWIIESNGYRTMWLVTAVSMVIGSVVALMLADDF